jgi:hypothetical protein
MQSVTTLDHKIRIQNRPTDGDNECRNSQPYRLRENSFFRTINKLSKHSLHHYAHDL